MVVALLTAAGFLASACAAGPRAAEAPVDGPPLPAGISAEAGQDVDGIFYRFASALDPDLALAAYAETLAAAGYSATGWSRGWARFSDGQRVIAARAETGPPTQVLVRVVRGGRDVAWPGGASLAPMASPGAPRATPGDTGRARARPDPPHAGRPGVANGASPGVGKPERTPKPTKSPKPEPTPKPDKSPKPTKSPKPEPTPKPDKSPKPDPTPKPDKSPKP